MTDLAERLRGWADLIVTDEIFNPATEEHFAADLAEAADRITELEAIVDQIPADRLNKWHTVTVSTDGWHMAHPILCDLTECPFDDLARGWSDPPAALGVWRWHDFDDEPWEWESDPREVQS